MTRSSAEQLIQERAGELDVDVFNGKYIVAKCVSPYSLTIF